MTTLIVCDDVGVFSEKLSGVEPLVCRSAQPAEEQNR